MRISNLIQINCISFLKGLILHFEKLKNKNLPLSTELRNSVKRTALPDNRNMPSVSKISIFEKQNPR